MKRYIWARKGTVYHDRSLHSERCNLDDVRGRVEGDAPPEGRRLCAHCKAMHEWLKTIPHG